MVYVQFNLMVFRYTGRLLFQLLLLGIREQRLAHRMHAHWGGGFQPVFLLRLVLLRLEATSWIVKTSWEADQADSPEPQSTLPHGTEY